MAVGIKKIPKEDRPYERLINLGVESLSNEELLAIIIKSGTREESSKDIDKHLIDYFPNTSLEDLTTIIDRYKKGDAWRDNTSINEEEWKHIQEIVISAGELKTYVPYKELIYTKYFNE